MTMRPSILPSCIRAKISLIFSSGSAVTVALTLPAAAMSSDSCKSRRVPTIEPRMVMPFSYALMLFRFAEALWKILKGQKVNLGLADEAKDAIETFNIPKGDKNK